MKLTEMTIGDLNPLEHFQMERLFLFFTSSLSCCELEIDLLQHPDCLLSRFRHCG
jgi:hypothetical protein